MRINKGINMQQLKEKAKLINIEISDDKIETFEKYYNRVIECNKLYNLTSIIDKDEFIDKHFIDSIIGEKYISKNSNVCDIGAGAGFPSIPLKIIRDDLSFTLIDSLNKRVNFLNETVKELGLKNVFAEHLRAEEAGKGKYREKFDVIVNRAVASLPTLIEYCIPLLKVGGIMIAYKGNAEEELSISTHALQELSCKIDTIDKYILPNTDYNRTLIIIKKVGKTKKIYPRDKNKPKLSPL